jgi:hypothetical protein
MRVLLPAASKNQQESDDASDLDEVDDTVVGVGVVGPAPPGSTVPSLQQPISSITSSNGTGGSTITATSSSSITAKKRPRTADSKRPAKRTMTGGRRDAPSWEHDDNSPAEDGKYQHRHYALENEPPVFHNHAVAVTVRPAAAAKIDDDNPDEEEKKQSATSTTDDSFEHFAQILKSQRGLEIVPCQGDGNCLFRAVSLQVYGDAEQHEEVREKCCDFMERDPQHFAPFVATTGAEDANYGAGDATTTNSAFFEYIRRKRQTGVHGNNPEIQAVSELFNRPVEVFTPERGATALNIFQTAYKCSDVPIRLSYHDGNHYNAVIDPLVPTAGLGLGLPGLQPGLADKMQVAEAVRESDHLADELELEQVLKASEEDELHRVIKESSEASMGMVGLLDSCLFTNSCVVSFVLSKRMELTRASSLLHCL